MLKVSMGEEGGIMMKRYQVNFKDNKTVIINAVNASTERSSLIGPVECVKFWNEQEELVGFFKMDEVKDFYVVE